MIDIDILYKLVQNEGECVNTGIICDNCPINSLLNSQLCDDEIVLNYAIELLTKI